jgi:hypothetical protein
MTASDETTPPRFDTLAARVLGMLPAGGAALREDLRRNLHAALASAFARLNLVTQEEFEVQSAVLARTRAKLEALERRVQELEQQNAPPRAAP